MTKHPLYNALLAIAYIAALVTAVFYGADLLEDTLEETIFLPMGFLATFVLSAAVMAYLFFYQPVILLLDGQREQAVKLFLHTVALFAMATALILITALVVGVLYAGSCCLSGRDCCFEAYVVQLAVRKNASEGGERTKMSDRDRWDWCHPVIRRGSSV